MLQNFIFVGATLEVAHFVPLTQYIILVFVCVRTVARSTPYGSGVKTLGKEEVQRHRKPVQHDRMFVDTIHDS